MGLFCALKAHKPFDLAPTLTGVLKMLGQQELFHGLTSILLQIFIRDEDCPILYVIHILRPAHIVMFSMLPSVIHIMDHIHIGLQDIHIHDMTSEGEVVETCGKEEHEHCVLVIEGEVQTEILFFVVLVVADYLAEEHMVLEGGHVEVMDFQASGHEVIRLETVGKLRVHDFSVSNQCEIQDTVGVGTDDIVKEVEIEVLVHGKGGDRSYDVGILMGLVI